MNLDELIERQTNVRDELAKEVNEAFRRGHAVTFRCLEYALQDANNVLVYLKSTRDR